MAEHKRLVVPQLGSFLVKEPSRSVVFTELLKRDDGVLRGLLCAEGLGQLEAAGEIDRFVFEVRHAVEHGREYPMEGFGRMKPGPNGTIVFVYEPRAAEAFDSSSATVVPGSAAPVTTTAASGPVDAKAPAAVGRAALRPEQVAEAVKTAFAETKVSPSVKMNPDPSVRGLRYGRPPTTTAAYTYVDRPPRRRADRFIWIAVLAALIAMAAIAFGYYRELRERQAEREYLEQPEPQADPAAVRLPAPEGATPAPTPDGVTSDPVAAARNRTGSSAESAARGVRNEAAQVAARIPAGTRSESPTMRKTTDNS